MSSGPITEHFDVNQYLGSKGKTVTIKSKFEPPKTDVQKKGHKGIVDLLMPLKAKGQRGKIDDAILLAASMGHLDIVKMCQSKGADTEIRSPENGATPLINAAEGGHTTTVMHLVDTKGADLNAVTTDDNSTALHKAAAGGHFDVAQCLVFKGCDVFVKSKHGTALDIAQKNDHEKIVTLLKPIINNHQNHQNKYFRACTKGDLEEVKLSLKEMKKESQGKAKESKAAEAERKALAKEAGGIPAADGKAKDEGKPANMKDVDIQDQDGRTGIMLAGANGHMNVVEYLAKEGAKIDIMDNEGFTALMLSAVNRHRPVVEFLLAHKADVTASCKYGTALDIMLDLYN